MAGEPLSTTASAAQTAFRLNRLADYLYEHAIRGIDGHDSEGVIEREFSDSNDDRLSTKTIVLGALRNGNRVRVLLPTTGSPIYTPSIVSGLFRHSFHGVKFLRQDDFSLAVEFVVKKVQANGSLTTDEKTAITKTANGLKFQTSSYSDNVVVRGTTYTTQVIIDISSGLIQLDYSRPA